MSDKEQAEAALKVDGWTQPEPDSNTWYKPHASGNGYNRITLFTADTFTITGDLPLAKLPALLSSSPSGGEVEQLKRQRDSLREACAEMEAERNRYRDAIRANNTFKQGENGPGYHIWDQAEENHLESLTCPVLIPAEWLRNLIEDASSGGISPEEVKALEWAITNAFSLGFTVEDSRYDKYGNALKSLLTRLQQKGE